MASEIDYCNLALSHLGDKAAVSSLTSSDSSVQAQLCARFYPMARDVLLCYDWGFNSRREALSAAVLPSVVTEWKYAYKPPSNMLRLLAVLDPAATDDFSAPQFPAADALADWVTMPPPPRYTPQPFVIEASDSGESVIYTNQESAVARYTIYVTDTSRFSPLFGDTLGWLLASYLAGPILKGASGIKVGQAMLKQAEFSRAQAKSFDASQDTRKVEQHVPWMANR